jgi:hypothetical protein
MLSFDSLRRPGSYSLVHVGRCSSFQLGCQGIHTLEPVREKQGLRNEPYFGE